MFFKVHIFFQSLQLNIFRDIYFRLYLNEIFCTRIYILNLNKNKSKTKQTILKITLYKEKYKLSQFL